MKTPKALTTTDARLTSFPYCVMTGGGQEHYFTTLSDASTCRHREGGTTYTLDRGTGQWSVMMFHRAARKPTASPTLWKDKPVATTAGRMDALEFAEDRLNAMRNVVRQMYDYEQDNRLPPYLRKLVISLTCMVRTDDAENAGLIGSRPDIVLPPVDDDEDDTPLHDEASHAVETSCCQCSEQAVGWYESKPYCAKHWSRS